MEVGAHAVDPEALVVCNCGGGRSALAAKTLQEMGYTNVASLAGGLKAWMNRSLPLEA
jgi:rhodanese-related sulfurtransferase